ncbi:MAG TPA: SIS domain-containing protein [Bryobacteraceae bacterium]|nr:SIS domain-containing protein [Bryobacteraceae bacterium]
MGAAASLTSAQFKESVLRKCRESAEMKQKFFDANAGALEEVCMRLAKALASGNQLFVMGNGGSSCDALHVAVEFVHPIIEKRRAFPARALTSDTALLTAISNDADFSQTFAEQLRLFGKPGDVAVGISTSGNSANVNYGLEAAREMGMLTIGFAGKDGGRTKDIAEYCLTVPSFSIHRIQEVHTTLLHVLWDMVHVLLGEEDII